MIDLEELRRIASAPAVDSGPYPRMELWWRLIDACQVKRIAEIGVAKGHFSAAILERCDSICQYYMVDPWRHLADWHKPGNLSEEQCEHMHAEAMDRTEPWADKRIVLRGTTAEVVDQIPDETLDLVYVDGDHTLRGITVDLIKCYTKVRPGGWLTGDDLSPSIWQHSDSYEPTMVFPFAIYFAEAVDERIFALPHNQFVIEKQTDVGFELCDLTGSYGDLTLRSQLRR